MRKLYHSFKCNLMYRILQVIQRKTIELCHSFVIQSQHPIQIEAEAEEKLV